LEVRRLSGTDGARQARGLAVVIDVFRAFTTAAFIMANGADRIIPVEGIDEAFRIRGEHPAWVLAGEEHGFKVPGFDYGNSPADVEHVDFTGRTVIQRTSSGTRGIALSSGADEVLPGSFVMADAIIRHINRSHPDVVCLVAMGWEGERPALEDDLCAEYIEAKLMGAEPDFQGMCRRIREDPSGAKFFGPDQTTFKERDFQLAMSLNQFGFTLRVERGDYPYFRIVDGKSV